MPTPNAKPLGPGTLTIGETGSLKDLSIQITAASVEWDVSSEDSIPVLSGDEVAGDVTYKAQLKGKILQDFDSAGIVAWSWTNKGLVLPTVFVPRKDGSLQVKGNVRISPFNIGGDVKKTNDSDIEMDFIGEPTISAYTAA